MNTKKCTGCKENKPITEFYKDKKRKDGLTCWCRVCYADSAKNRIYDPAKNKEARKKYQAKYPDRIRAKRKRLNRRQSYKLKMEALGVYGGKCVCCGEGKVEFLAIDHIDGNGNKHRKEVRSAGGGTFYRWLKKNNWPIGYRVLCHNCNMSIGFFGYCPHDGWSRFTAEESQKWIWHDTKPIKD